MKKSGIDTCVVLRLLIGAPEDQAQKALFFLEKSYANGDVVYVSDLVAAETYHALCHHYEVPFYKAAKQLAEFLSSPMITPSGHALAVLREYKGSGAGAVDRLIRADLLDHSHEIMTFDKKFSMLGSVKLL